MYLNGTCSGDEGILYSIVAKLIILCNINIIEFYQILNFFIYNG